MWVPQGRLEHLVLAARPAKTAHDFARRHEKRLDCSGDSGERAGRRGGGGGGDRGGRGKDAARLAEVRIRDVWGEGWWG